MSDAPPPYPQQPQPQQQPPPYPPQGYPPQQPPPGYPNSPGGYGAPPPGTPGTAPAPVDKAAIRPKARWFWIGGAIMVIGVVGAILFGVFGFLGISDKVDDFERVSPGSDTIRVESTGEYVIYVEDGSSFASVEVISPDGDVVNTAPYLTGLTYGFNGRSGEAIATFDADDTGRFTINTDSQVAIGDSIADDLLRTILIPFVIAGLGFLIGLIVIIVTAVKRSGSKKRLAYGG